MRFQKFNNLLLASTLLLSLKTWAADKKTEVNSTLVNYQVTASRQTLQDEIIAALHIEKTDMQSDNVQSQINTAMQSALNSTKKYAEVKVSTGRYFVYKDEQKNVWKGSQTINLDSFNLGSISELSGELQKRGFLVDNFSYTLSSHKKRAMDDDLRLELIQKASQVATQVFAKGLNKKFLRFAQIDFNSQNYFPVATMRAVGLNTANSTPIAQSGESEIQMTANVSAIFGE